MSQPIGPTKPSYKPAEFLQETEDSHDISDCSMSEILELIGEVPHENVRISSDFDSNRVYITWDLPKRKNPNYETEMAIYKMRMSGYEKDLKRYEVQMEIWHMDELRKLGHKF